VSFLREVTPVLLTYNEEPNIERTLVRLDWASDIVLVDSFSKDETVTIARRHRSVRVFQRAFDTHATQWNFAIHETSVTTDWVLALDADYVLPDEFIDEVSALQVTPKISAYRADFRYCVVGRPLRGTLYPPVTVLFRKDKARYEQEGHTQRVTINGMVGALRSKILHDDRKPPSRWLSSQQQYARLEVDYLLASSARHLRQVDRVRLMAWPAPILVFLYVLLVKGCILDGWPGWLYVLQRTVAELLLAIEIISRRLATS
jgi:glycosyltransferase involved in cell wall biosynthesis